VSILPKCNGCSTEISEKAKYCPNCGKNTAKTIVEEFDVKSEELIQKTKEILHEGNVTKLIVENEEGKTLLEIPATGINDFSTSI
jgi:predicted amidophosphoribosyltransferase